MIFILSLGISEHFSKYFPGEPPPVISHKGYRNRCPRKDRPLTSLLICSLAKETNRFASSEMKLYVRFSKFLFCRLKFFVSLSEIKISKTSHDALNINEMFMEARNAF